MAGSEDSWTEIREPSPDDACHREYYSGWAGPGDTSDAEFYQAAKQGDLERLKAAITPELNLDLLYGRREDWHGLTALAVAAGNNHAHIVKFLIELGANVDMEHEGSLGTSRPLHEAARQANPDIVRMLLDAGADVNAPFDDHMCYGGPATSLVLMDMQNQRNYWPEERRIEQRHLDTIELLLSRGIDINAPCPNCSFTLNLLESAVAAGSVDLAKSLIARGACQKSSFLGNELILGSRLVSIAAEHNATTRMLEYLMGELGLKDPDLDGLSHLLGDRHEVALPMARMLFDAAMANPDRDPNFPNTERVREQFCRAATENNMPLVQFMLDRGVDVNGLGPHGVSPLLAACQDVGDAALVKLLLDRGANKNYRFPRKVVEHCGYPILRYLDKKRREEGGPPSRLPSWMLRLHRVTSRHPSGRNNALHEIGNHMRSGTQGGEVVMLLLRSGVDVEGRNSLGETPLLTHARNLTRCCFHDSDIIPARVECFGLLVEGCRNVDAVDSQGRSALHLIAHSADHWPCAGGTARKGVELLLQKGADPNIRDHEGVTAADRLGACRYALELDLASLLDWVVV